MNDFAWYKGLKEAERYIIFAQNYISFAIIEAKDGGTNYAHNIDELAKLTSEELIRALYCLQKEIKGSNSKENNS